MRAILNANYMAKRLEKSYPVLYKGRNGTCAHEFILDIRPLKDSAGNSEIHIAVVPNLSPSESRHSLLS